MAAYDAGVRSLQTYLMPALCALMLSNTGCITKMILNGQIAGTRQASTAIDTLHDYEVARVTAFNGVAQFEGMHYLAPDNTDALFMLAKGWTGATFGWTEDEAEQAEDDEGLEGPNYLHLKQRAIAGYDRGLRYGIELLEHYYPGFEAAKKNDTTLRAYLAQFTDPEEHALPLFWTGYAWISKTNMGKDDPVFVSELYVGVAMLERVIQLDEKVMYGSAHTVLGAYHARSAMAELDESKKHFEKAIEISQGKLLLAKVQYAAKYHCTKGNKDEYLKLLNEVMEAEDPFPEQRLQNVIAKRRAQRYLGKTRMKECAFD